MLPEPDSDQTYVKAEAGSAELPTAVFQAELDAVNTRREALGIPPASEAGEGEEGPVASRGLVGLAHSGGGIRSSTFCLGVLQALDRAGALPFIDYLSTVSGGGYIGSCLSSYFTGSPGHVWQTWFIAGIPNHAQLSAGNQLADGRWKVEAHKIEGLTLCLPAGQYNISLQLTAVSESSELERSLPLHLLPGSSSGLKYCPGNHENGFCPTISGEVEAGKVVNIGLRLPMRDYPFPFRHTQGQPESQNFMHLRKYANYLKPPRVFAGLRIPGLLVRGMLINFLIVLPFLLAFAGFTIYRSKTEIRDALQTIELNYTIPKTVLGPQYSEFTIDLNSKVYWPVPAANELFLEDLRELLGLKDEATEPVKAAHKYIVLSGVPKNTYSKEARFLDEQTWLFDGDAAESLQLKLLLPPLDKDVNIMVRAWQSNEAIYEDIKTTAKTVLYFNELDGAAIKAFIAGINAAKQSEADYQPLLLSNRVINLGNKKSSGYNLGTNGWVFTNGKIVPADGPPGRSLSRFYRNPFMWRDEPGNRYVLISNLNESFGYRNFKGQNLRNGSWVLKNEEIAQIETLMGMYQMPNNGVVPEMITWQSGVDSAVFDPVSRLINATFKWTTKLLLVFLALLIISPLMQMGLKASSATRWKQRDLLSRHLCGGGLAVVAIFALVELQPTAIYLFYQIEQSFSLQGLLGGIDNISMIISILTTLAGGIASTRLLSKKSGLTAKVCLYALGIIGPATLWLVYLNLCGWGLNPANLPSFLGFMEGRVASIFIAVAVFLFIFSRFVYDVNRTSLHPFYRDRLSKAFLFLSSTDGSFPQHNDEQSLSALNSDCAPYHLLNTTLNVQGKSKVNIRGRQAEFFTFGKHYVGSQTTGYLATEKYEQVDKNMGLATAMTISAAAAGPNMGRCTVKGLTFIMALFNLRLGYWANNPRTLGEKQQKGGLNAWRNWQHCHVGPFYLILEMLGLVNEKSRFINLSDGGHLENLGLYELVRRRRKHIIVSDAEADAEMKFGGLADAIRMIQIDMGIAIKMDGLDAIRPAQGNEPHFAVGTIQYPEGAIGQLLYIKSSFSGDENVYVQNYKRLHPAFPHEATSDQFFDETQFEAYRALGNHVGSSIFASEAGRNFLQAVLATDLQLERSAVKG